MHRGVDYQTRSPSEDPTPSCNAARSHPLTTSSSTSTGDAVSARKRSIAAITAAASSGEGSGENECEAFEGIADDETTGPEIRDLNDWPHEIGNAAILEIP
jgi:hypothetical protein